VPENDSLPRHFSTDSIPERDRVAFVREVYGRAIVKHDIEPHPDSVFYWHSTLRALPGLGLASTVCSAVHTERTAAQIDSDDLVLNITLSGRRIVRQFGREAVVGPGSVAVTRSLYVASCDCEAHSRLVNVRVPLDRLSRLIGNLDEILVRTDPAGTEQLALLLRYVEMLQNAEGPSDPGLQRMVAAHVHELVALTLGANRETHVAPPSNGVRAARLAAVLKEIDRGSGEQALNALTIAKRLGVTPRYIHLLLEDTGKSFSHHVLRKRLEKAVALLRDPQWRHRKIADIAAEVGFTDLSYFNRAFRRHYGATPSDLRAAADRGE